MNLWRMLLLSAVLLATMRPIAFAATETVCIVTIHEEITQNTLYLVRRAMREAIAVRAAALVLDLDTNGGRVDATEEIIRLVERASCPTYTLVNPKAYSAGAFLAAATDRIYMTTGSVIGAATPVMMIPSQGVQELPKSYEEKLSSAMRALIRTTAQTRGHNPDVFEAMVDRERGLTVDGTVIVEKGKLLTLTNVEAQKEYGNPPRPLLSAGTVGSVEELLKRVGLERATQLRIEPYGLEIVGRWLTAISPLLILIGFVAIYIEMKTPGIGLPSLVALICFALYFGGYFLAGLAGWEEMVVFALGVVLLAVEIFVLPGFGWTGIIGVTLVLAALVMAMLQRMPGSPFWPSWQQLQWPLLKVMGGFLGAAGVMAVLARFLPETPLFRKLELSATTSAAEGYVASHGPKSAQLHAVGVAETVLRPSGKGRFGDELVDVVTEGDMIEAGSRIRIIERNGNRVVVTRAE